MDLKLSTKGQIVLAGALRRKLGLRAGDLLDAKVQGGRIVLTPRKRRFSKATILIDPIIGLPVLSAGKGAPPLTSKQVREILEESPSDVSEPVLQCPLPTLANASLNAAGAAGMTGTCATVFLANSAVRRTFNCSNRNANFRSKS